MNAAELLRSLRAEGVQLWCEGEKLRYRAPKARLAPGLIEALASYKLEIIELLQRPVAAGPCFQAWSPSVSKSRDYPLSFAQQRMWFLRQRDPESCALNVKMGFQLWGPLNQQALQKSLDELVTRHEAFRTTCTVKNGVPLQVVATPDESRAPLVIFDLRQIPEAEQQVELEKRVRSEARQTFDLECLPLLRSVLFQLAENYHVLLLTTHHFVVDGWSVGVLFRDLSALYNNHRSGRTSEFGKLAIRYRDYSLWQSERLKGAVLEELLTYWRKQLDGVAELNLPTDRTPSLSPSRGGATLLFDLQPELSSGLKALSRREGVTLFMTLLAAFKTLLYRYSRQDDIVVGTAVSDRCMVETQALVGCFANTLVLRTTFERNPTFRELLRRVHDIAVGAFDHQDLPFEMLIRQLHPERFDNRNPLLHASFFLNQHSSDQTLKFDEITARHLPIDMGMSRFDLLLEMRDERDKLSGFFEYNTDLFYPETIQRMAGHFQTLLEAIAANPKRTVSDLPILPAAECEQLLNKWNQTAVDYPRGKCFDELFIEQAAHTPQSIAVADESEVLSYAELDAGSSEVASKLRGLGVGPEVLVGICMERSAEMLIGVLGIMKAGGAYVPLDPAFPRERLYHIIEDARPGVILSQKSLERDLLNGVAGVVCFEELGGLESGELPRQGERSSENLAYVLYTSGSTGKPKGVEISHQGLVNFLCSMQREPGLGSQDVLLAVTTLSFDIAGLELFLPLMVGGRVVIADSESTRDGVKLKELFEKSGASVMQATPASWKMLIEAGWKGDGRLKILCGGEAWTSELAEQLLKRGGSVWNMYGPTETTIWSAVSRVEPGKPVVVGGPIANTSFYILDEHRQPQPIGVPGELYIGGESVARGYHKRPELTAEKFVADLFREGGRLYRTGDLARYVGAGRIEFLGRMDNQVKIRGFRIELGEIESVLRQATAVGEAVVVAHEDKNGDKRLVAYVVSEKAGEILPIEQLRDLLKQKLPDYMVPAAFVVLAKLPLTPNGKVDRRALPEPEVQEAGYRAPRTPQEEILCELFGEVLGVRRVGIDANFFVLGGHSLLVMQLVSRVRGTLGLELAVRTVFEAPTVAELAGRLPGAEKAGAPLVRQERPERIPLSYTQERLWFLDRFEGSSPEYNIHEALRLLGDLDLSALERSIDAIVERHACLRTRFEEADGKPHQVIEPAMRVPLRTEDLSVLDGTSREQAIVASLRRNSEQAFALARGPMVRLTLLKLGERDHILLIVWHHIVTDAWSIGIFARELSLLYSAFSKGQENPLAPLPIEYSDYAIWQRSESEEGKLEEQFSYWKSRLAGAPSLELPTDKPRPSQQGYSGIERDFVLPPNLCSQLEAFNREQGVTPFMTLTAAFQVLLARYCRQEDILMGTAVANRSSPELENLIGPFVNSLVIRSDLSGNPNFREVVRRVREAALGAHQHRDLPFERLVHELNPERDMSRHPIFQATLTLQNAPRQLPELPGLQVLRHPVTYSFVHCDLELYLSRDEGTWSGGVVCSSDLFESATIERFARHYSLLIERLLAESERTVWEVPLLSGEEREKMVVEWNQTVRDYPRGKCFDELFIEQAAHTPQSIAVADESEVLSYAELDAGSSEVASKLRGLGVGPEVLVGICMERSAEMLIGVLGIMKAGGAYVPLDPAFPRERLYHIIEDARPGVILSQKSLERDLLNGVAGVVCFEELGGLESGELPRQGERSSENLAYVLYTSGSTGKPKGVEISHQGLVNFLCSMQREPGLGSQDVLLAVTTLSFDIAGLELFLPLMVGGRVVIADSESTRDGVKLKELFEKSGASVMQATPASWKMLIEAGWKGDGRLKILCGGEAWTSELAEQLLKRGGSVWNMYGPTETTIWSAVSRVEPGKPVVVGGPIANTSFYILDEHRQPQPIGVPGELYIGGESVARGYHKRPELTAEKFVADLFREGGRLYRTGDLARYVGAGRIEFLGRMDNQVKIRGFRIELGEIESVLRQATAVGEAVVVAHEDKNGDKRLVAYVVSEKAGEILPIEQLRDLLKQKLPDYMVPAAFVVLAKLPLTPNGKVDRRALPEPEVQEAGYRAPRTPQEEILCELFGEVLGVRRVGIDANFFVLGGHSLLVMQLVSRVRGTLGLELAVRTVFEAPTVAELAGRLPGAEKAGAPLVRQERPERIPLSYAEKRFSFLDRLGSDANYKITEAIRLRGVLDVAVLEQAIDILAERHEALRTRFAEEDGEPVQIIEPVAQVRLQIHDLEGHAAEDSQGAIRAALQTLAREPFALKRAPLMRIGLLRLGSGDHVLYWIWHHIIADGWSIEVFKRELSEIYTAVIHQRRPINLPELPFQYADYAIWQRNYLQGEQLERLLAYWRKQLAHSVALELPLDRRRHELQSHAGATESIVFPHERREELDALSRGENATPFIALLAAVKVLLFRYTGQEDVSLGIPIANRGHAEFERILGCLLNTLVLRTRLESKLIFRDFLSQVRETALEAYAHQELPFEKLLEELQPERTLNRTPLFQVFVNYASLGWDGLRLPGLSLTNLGPFDIEARFDLSFYFSDLSEGLRLDLVYNRDLFEPGSIRRMLERFDTLLQAILVNPGEQVGALSILAPDDRKPRSFADNIVRPRNSYIPFSQTETEQTIGKRFTRQAQRYGTQTAVKTLTHDWTYEELDQRADALAREMLRVSAGTAERAALLLQPDAPMIAAVIACVKAGWTYIPLAPSQPVERIARTIADAQARVLMTDSANRLLANTVTAAGMQVIEIEASQDLLGSDRPMVEVSPDASAYLLYTSGSTGEQKAIVQSHRNVLHHIRNYTNALHIASEDRMLLLASYTFDAAVMDIFGALLNGATLLPFDLRTEGFASLAGWMASERVTIYHSTPTLFRHFLRAIPDQTVFSGVRLVVLGGEPVLAQDCQLFKERFPRECILVNGFGQSEYSFSLQYLANSKTLGHSLPVGYPLDQTEVSLIDTEGNPGQVFGEITIRSPYLAQGYWQRPELSAQVFVRDPSNGSFSVYRTGDLGRLRSDGAIDFAGRKDFQLKVRGHRVEPGEVEAMLCRHSGVGTAVVVGRPSAEDEVELVAYVVSANDRSVSVDQLHAFLARSLPDYMIPAAIVTLETMPLTISGKINRQALPAPERAGKTVQHVAARTPFETALVEIWSELLRVDKISVRDDFFAIGGHSLVAMRLVSEIREKLDVEVPLRTIFERRTIEQLALYIAELQAEATAPEEIEKLLSELESISEDNLRAP